MLRQNTKITDKMFIKNICSSKESSSESITNQEKWKMNISLYFTEKNIVREWFRTATVYTVWNVNG